MLYGSPSGLKDHLSQLFRDANLRLSPKCHQPEVRHCNKAFRPESNASSVHFFFEIQPRVIWLRTGSWWWLGLSFGLRVFFLINHADHWYFWKISDMTAYKTY